MTPSSRRDRAWQPRRKARGPGTEGRCRQRGQLGWWIPAAVVHRDSVPPSPAIQVGSSRWLKVDVEPAVEAAVKRELYATTFLRVQEVLGFVLHQSAHQHSDGALEVTDSLFVSQTVPFVQ